MVHCKVRRGVHAITLTYGSDIDTKLRNGLCACGHLAPLFEGFIAKLSERVAGDQMALDVEQVVDGGVKREERLRRAKRFETFVDNKASGYFPEYIIALQNGEPTIVKIWRVLCRCLTSAPAGET